MKLFLYLFNYFLQLPCIATHVAGLASALQKDIRGQACTATPDVGVGGEYRVVNTFKRSRY